MYLSRLVLNLRSRQVRFELARPYEMHRTLLRAFPDKLADGEERVLYRIETEPRTEMPMLLVQSWLRPAWDHLADGYLAAGDDNPAVKVFEPRIAVGQVLAFRLAANPTKRLSRSLPKGREKSKRVGLFKVEDQEIWIQRKGEQHGFHVLMLTIGGQGQIKSTRPSTSKDEEARLITLQGVQFDGILQVTDAEAFGAAVATGIGSGKAFGCGLLSLAATR
jgi:CRISPR system Cascade subunit CasE